jgi:choline dehydrogenase-like flavoprotein
MTDYNHMAGFVAVAETEPRPCNRVELSDVRDRHGLPVAHVTFEYSDNDRRMQDHARRFMGQMLEAAGGATPWTSDDTSHILGTCRMGADRETSVVNADGRSWEVNNLWICDGSLFPTAGGVNPSLTIQALACRMGARIRALAARGEL